MKKISIILSIYNCEDYLDKCLSSVENQTMNKKDYELIIINDGSKDKSIEIIKKYKKANKNWKLIDRENRGLATSRNEGLDICCGHYITFLDSDDYYNNNSLEVMYNEMEKNKAEIGLFRSNRFDSKSSYGDAYEELFSKMPCITNVNDNFNLLRCIRSCPVIYSNKMVNNVRFIEGFVHEDNYFCSKTFFKASRILISDKVVYNTRIREGNSISITQNIQYKSFYGLLNNIIATDIELKKREIIKLHLNQLYVYLLKLPKDDYAKAKKDIFNYLKDMYLNQIISRFRYLKLKNYIAIKIFLYGGKKRCK